MLAALLPVLGPMLERLADLIPDPEARAKAVAQAQTEMITALSASDAAQAATNTAQAQHPSFFVAGARPAFLWLCVALVAYHMALRDIISAVSGVALPAIETDDLWTLTFGLLGLGTLRTYEKVRGVDTKGVGRR